MFPGTLSTLTTTYAAENLLTDRTIHKRFLSDFSQTRVHFDALRTVAWFSTSMCSCFVAFRLNHSTKPQKRSLQNPKSGDNVKLRSERRHFCTDHFSKENHPGDQKLRNTQPTTMTIYFDHFFVSAQKFQKNHHPPSTGNSPAVPGFVLVLKVECHQEPQPLRRCPFNGKGKRREAKTTLTSQRQREHDLSFKD